MSPCAVQIHMHRKILESPPNKKLNDKIYITFKETCNNTNLHSVSE